MVQYGTSEEDKQGIGIATPPPPKKKEVFFNKVLNSLNSGAAKTDQSSQCILPQEAIHLKFICYG